MKVAQYEVVGNDQKGSTVSPGGDRSKEVAPSMCARDPKERVGPGSDRNARNDP